MGPTRRRDWPTSRFFSPGSTVFIHGFQGEAAFSITILNHLGHFIEGKLKKKEKMKKIHPSRQVVVLVLGEDFHLVDVDEVRVIGVHGGECKGRYFGRAILEGPRVVFPVQGAVDSKVPRVARAVVMYRHLVGRVACDGNTWDFFPRSTGIIIHRPITYQQADSHVSAAVIQPDGGIA